VTAVVADTSPLVALHQISLMRILPALFGVILIPPAVAQEAISVNLESWIEIRSLQREIPPAVLQAEVDLGESEAISLALEVQASRLIVDDLQARRLATSLGLTIIGTTGLLLAAKQKGLIPAVSEPLNDLLRLGFYLHPDLHRNALVRAGENVV
jgi:uncharacterized protein